MFLRNILQMLDERWTLKFHLPNTSSFTQLLKSLRPMEKDYIAGCIIKKEWNLGSPIVLDILQQCGILRMSDFMIFKIENESVQEVQLIFNDLLEIQQLSLLLDLVENTEGTDPRSQLLEQCVSDGFKRFIEDLSTGRYSFHRNYLNEMKSLVTNGQMERIRMLHLKLLLDIEGCTLVEAVSRLGAWLNDDNGNTGLVELVKELLYDQEKVVNYLIKKVSSDKFHGWAWYARILCKIARNLKTQSVKVVKSFLRELYTSFLLQKNRNFFYIMVLTSRVLCFSDQERFGDYSLWYKNQFSDMRYKISKDDFVSTLEMLQSLVSYEDDIQVLEMYSKTSISPPMHCNDLVLSFKQMCRSKIERLKLNLSGDRLTMDTVVLIDDDDGEMEF